MSNHNEYIRRYRQSHKEVVSAVLKRYREKNREKINELQRKYDAKKRAWKAIVKEFNAILIDGYFDESLGK